MPIKTITYNGVTMSISQWAKCLGVKPNVLRARKEYGWKDKDIITIPLRVTLKEFGKREQRDEHVKEFLQFVGEKNFGSSSIKIQGTVTLVRGLQIKVETAQFWSIEQRRMLMELWSKKHQLSIHPKNFHFKISLHELPEEENAIEPTLQAQHATNDYLEVKTYRTPVDRSRMLKSDNHKPTIYFHDDTQSTPNKKRPPSEYTNIKPYDQVGYKSINT